MNLREVEAVKKRIDDTFLEYCKADYRSVIREFLDGRLSGLLFASRMLGAIDAEEYEYLNDAIKAVDIHWRKGVKA